MANRREFISTATLTAAGIALAPLAACSQEPGATAAAPPAATPTPFKGPLLTRAIPATGEKIPVIGMGTSGSFEVGTVPPRAHRCAKCSIRSSPPAAR